MKENRQDAAWLRGDKAKLALGTAQLGMRYGVHNVLGRQPTFAEAESLLEAALAAGIDTFDTASVYGTAEAVLGRFRLAERTAAGRPVCIVSKLRPGTEDTANAVLKELKGTLDRLGTGQLGCYLLHDAVDMARPGIMEGLVQAKEQKLVRLVGVSVYEPEEAMCAVGDSRIDAIQVPYNALDQRLDAVGFFDKARKAGKVVFVRSAFLQGLLLMPPKEAESRVPGSGDYIGIFQRIAANHGYDPQEAAFLYSFCHPAVDYVVFGAETVGQLRANAVLTIKADGFGSCYAALRGAFSGVPKEIIVPSLWQA